MEELVNCDTQTIAKLFDQIDGYLFAAGIQHTVHAGGSYAGTIGQFIGLDVALFADFLKAVGYGFFYAHWDHLRKKHKKNYALAYSHLRSFEKRFIIDTRNTQMRKRRNTNETVYQLSDVMTDYLCNFAKTGNPNGDNLPQWDATKKPTDPVLHWGGDGIRMAQPDIEKLEEIFRTVKPVGE